MVFETFVLCGLPGVLGWARLLRPLACASWPLLWIAFFGWPGVIIELGLEFVFKVLGYKLSKHFARSYFQGLSGRVNVGALAVSIVLSSAVLAYSWWAAFCSWPVLPGCPSTTEGAEQFVGWILNQAWPHKGVVETPHATAGRNTRLRSSILGANMACLGRNTRLRSSILGANMARLGCQLERRINEKVIQASQATLQELHGHLKEIASNNSKLEHTLVRCADILTSGIGGAMLVVLASSRCEELPYVRLDRGALTDLWQCTASNLFRNADAFELLLSAFCEHTDSDRWETTLLERLKEQLQLSSCCHKSQEDVLLSLTGALSQQPKDGAIILSHGGSVLATAAKLDLPTSWQMRRSDGTDVGTRHAAAINTGEWLTENQVSGAVFVRSDSGGVHAILPRPTKGYAPFAYHIPHRDSCAA